MALFGYSKLEVEVKRKESVSYLSSSGSLGPVATEIIIWLTWLVARDSGLILYMPDLQIISWLPGLIAADCGSETDRLHK